jgi:Ca-activated chloride channel family protein
MAQPLRLQLKKNRIRSCAPDIFSPSGHCILVFLLLEVVFKRDVNHSWLASVELIGMRTGFLFLTLLSAGAMAQQASLSLPPEEPSDAVFRSDARLVELQATVTGSDGHLLTDLPKYVFRVFENDAPQEIKVFKREDAPISLGLVIDASASMRDKREKVAKAALTLVRASNPSDQVFIMGFHDKPWIAQDFTQNIGEMETALKGIELGGATAMRDALSIGIHHVKRLGTNDKKAILVVTDGEDNSSSVDLDQLVRESQQTGVLIYAIGLLNDAKPAEAEHAKRDLDALTLATGGKVFYPKDVAEVDSIAQAVAHDLRNQYTIAYIPSNTKQDGTYRRIKVIVNSPPNATVKTRTGYYATREP